MDLRAHFPGIHVSTVLPGPVATDFGANARGGGIDSRKLPFVQSPEDVAEVIAGVIDRPRAHVYIRPNHRAMVAAYHAAEDMGAAEGQPPFVPGRPR